MSSRFGRQRVCSRVSNVFDIASPCPSSHSLSSHQCRRSEQTYPPLPIPTQCSKATKAQYSTSQYLSLPTQSQTMGTYHVLSTSSIFSKTPRVYIPFSFLFSRKCVFYRRWPAFFATKHCARFDETKLVSKAFCSYARKKSNSLCVAIKWVSTKKKKKKSENASRS